MWACTDGSPFRIYLVIGLVMIIICLSTICFAYSKIFIVLRWHQAKIQNQMNNETLSKMKQLLNSVINTFYVVFAFLVCFLPYCCLSIIINATRTRKKAVMLLNLYSTSIILFNSSLNPFIYWWRRREFRETVKQTFTNPCC